jgi:hypothetical protein
LTYGAETSLPKMPGFIPPAVQRHATIFEDLAKQTDRGVRICAPGVVRDEVLLEYKRNRLRSASQC